MMTVVPTVSAAVSSLRRPVAVFLVAGVLVFSLPLLVSCRLDQLLTAGPAPVVNLRPDTIGVAEAKPLPVTVTAGDRKSTRLNSSHSQISYAVFCLKKKNAAEML